MHPVAVCEREREGGRERGDVILAGWQESDLSFGHFVLHSQSMVSPSGV